MNFCVSVFFELPYIKLEEVYNVGLLQLLASAMVAFALNVSVVFLVSPCFSTLQRFPLITIEIYQIGRTSSLVMTLCGVLKDVLLVMASIAIWGTPISGLQYFGYSIALCGLMYYKLGAETLKAQFAQGQRTWAEYGAKHPAMRKASVFGGVLLVLFMLMGGIAPSVGYDSEYLKTILNSSEKAN